MLFLELPLAPRITIAITIVTIGMMIMVVGDAPERTLFLLSFLELQKIECL